MRGLANDETVHRYEFSMGFGHAPSVDVKGLMAREFGYVGELFRQRGFKPSSIRKPSFDGREAAPKASASERLLGAQVTSGELSSKYGLSRQDGARGDFVVRIEKPETWTPDLDVLAENNRGDASMMMVGTQVRGYGFPDRKSRDQFVREAVVLLEGGPAPARYSLGGQPLEGDVKPGPEGRIDPYADPFLADPPAMTSVEIGKVATISKFVRELRLPAGIRVEVVAESRLKPSHRGVEGFTQGGVVYLVAERMGNRGDMRRVVAHEMFGHVGLEALLGPEQEAAARMVAHWIRGDYKGSDEVRAFLRSKGYDVDAMDDVELMHEAVAHEGERGRLNDLPDFKERPGWWRKLMVRLKRALNFFGMPGFTAANLSDLYAMSTKAAMSAGKSAERMGGTLAVDAEGNLYVDDGSGTPIPLKVGDVLFAGQDATKATGSWKEAALRRLEALELPSDRFSGASLREEVGLPKGSGYVFDDDYGEVWTEGGPVRFSLGEREEYVDPTDAMGRLLRGGRKSTAKWFRVRAKRHLTRAGLGKGTVYEPSREMRREEAASTDAVEAAASQYRAAVKEEYGSSARRLGIPTARRHFDVLEGGDAKGLGRRPKTLAALRGMRGLVDQSSDAYLEQLRRRMSLLSRVGRPDEAKSLMSLIAKIKRNKGAYLHRFYRIHREPSRWTLHLKRHPELFRAALKEVAGEMKDAKEGPWREMTDAQRLEEAKRVLYAIRDAALDTGSIMRTLLDDRVSGVDLSALMKRHDLGPAVRAFLGEYREPVEVFATTLLHLTRLTASARFSNGILEEGWGKWLWSERPTGIPTAQIAQTRDKGMEPLSGLWSTPEVAQALRDIWRQPGQELMEGDGGGKAIFRWVVRLQSMVKIGKTVLSPTTANRNMMSGIFINMQAGDFRPWRPDFHKAAAESLGLFRTYMGLPGAGKRRASDAAGKRELQERLDAAMREMAGLGGDPRQHPRRRDAAPVRRRGDR